MNRFVIIPNVLILFITIAVTAGILLNAEEWYRWILSGIVGWFAVGTWTTELKYLGIYPIDQTSPIQPSDQLAVINFKRCLILPVIAIEIAYFPIAEGLYNSALTYTVFSTLWGPLHHRLSFKIMSTSLQTTESIRKVSFSTALGSTLDWASGALLLYVWHRSGFSALFWLIIGTRLAIMGAQALIIFLIKDKKSDDSSDTE